MARTQILAAGTTAATSTDITLTTGAHANISIFTASNSQIPDAARLELRIGTNGADALDVVLSRTKQTHHLIGPGIWRLYRPAQAIAIGASSEI